jgi:hypothetical protein
VFDEATELDRFAAFWVGWNKLAGGRADEMVCVERAGVSFFRALLSRHGIVGKPDTIKQVIARHRNYNARERDTSVRWSDLAATPSGGQLVRLAKSYGYEPESGEMKAEAK